MPGEPPGLDHAADRTPGGLVGRAAEVASVIRTLGDSRLTTVTGLPGAGKTAVSLAAAAAVAWNFADGTLIARLDTLRDEALLPHTIAAVLELDDRFASSRLEVLTEVLRDRRMLIVLDTCEHLLGASAELASALLAGCPGVRILATSRRPLRVAGESVISVGPLWLDDAAALFAKRAAQAQVRLADEDLVAITTVCVLLDKLPLAIELAVAQLAAPEAPGAPGALGTSGTLGSSGALALAKLIAALGSGADLGAGDVSGAGGALGASGALSGRHETMRAAIGWSHELCTPAERLLWARLSVFTGSFAVCDAQAVCAATDLTCEAVAVGLAALAEQSILLTDDRGCFFLPRTVRTYGRAMLGRLGQDQEFAQRHRRWQAGGQACVNRDDENSTI
jgi:predicted ATPase